MGYTHRVVYRHVRRAGPLKGTEVEADFKVCSLEAGLKALEALSVSDDLDFTWGEVQCIPVER